MAIFTSQYTAAQIDANIDKANTAYQKPQGGIPASDLANDVIPGDFGASGTNHAHGLVPDPGATQGDTKFLREDGTWAVPAGDVSGKEDKTNKVTSLSSSSTDTQYPSAKCVYDALNSGLKVATILNSSSMSADADKVTIISGNVGTATITLQVPNDNNAHVWNFIFNTGSSVAVTFATSSGTPVWVYPSNYALAKNTKYEMQIIGFNNTYYIRYGTFG